MEDLILKNIQVCKYCGKPFKEKTINILNKTKNIFVPSCNCYVELQNKKESQKYIENKRRFLTTHFENDMFKPLYENLEFNFIDESEAKNYAINFIEKFKLNKSKGFYFIGDIGRGKTTLSVCICKQLHKKNFNCLVIKVSALLDKLLDTIKFDNKLTAEKLLNIIVQYDFIVLDDLASEAYNDRRIDMLRRLIDYFIIYKKCIAFTCNPEKIYELKQTTYKYYADFNAIFDRLNELCPVKFEFRGESFRRKEL